MARKRWEDEHDEEDDDDARIDQGIVWFQAKGDADDATTKATTDTSGQALGDTGERHSITNHSEKAGLPDVVRQAAKRSTGRARRRPPAV